MESSSAPQKPAIAAIKAGISFGVFSACLFAYSGVAAWIAGIVSIALPWVIFRHQSRRIMGVACAVLAAGVFYIPVSIILDSGNDSPAGGSGSSSQSPKGDTGSGKTSGGPDVASFGLKPTAGPYHWGSGVLISTDGHVLTCAHVVEHGGEITVRRRGSTQVAEILAVDRERDLAVLKIAANGLACLALSPSSSPDPDVQAVGYAMTACSMWGKFAGREQPDAETVAPVPAPGGKGRLRLDGPLNPCMTGAPLVNAKGDLVGLVNQKWSGAGLRAAMASDISAIAAFLKSKGIAFTTGGAPLSLSSGEVYKRAAPAAVAILASPPSALPEGCWQPAVPRLLKTVGHPGKHFRASPDVKVAAGSSGARNATVVKLMSLESGKVTQTFKGHSQEVRFMAFSPDSRYLASAAYGGETLVWDLDKNTLWQKLPTCVSAAFSADSSLLALQGPERVRVFDVKKGDLVTMVEPKKWDLQGTLLSAIFLKKVNVLVTAGAFRHAPTKEVRGFHVWDPRTGKLLKTAKLHPAPLTYYGKADYRLFMTPDAKTTAVDMILARKPDGTAGRGNLMAVYDGATGNRRYFVNPYHMAGDPPRFSFFSPDSSLMGVRFTEPMLKGWMAVYDVKSGHLLWRFRGDHAAISPDGKRLVQPVGTHHHVRIWDIAPIIGK